MQAKLSSSLNTFVKGKKPLQVLTILLVIALAATTVYATPYVVEPFWMADPLDPGQPAPDPTTPPDTVVPGYWWRDTTNQNAIAQQTAGQFTGQVTQPYSSSKLKVLFYSTSSATNVIALLGTSSLFLIGAGGGRDEANAAKMAFQAFYPTFSTKNLVGIIYTSADTQVTWGGQFWRNAFRSNPPAPIYASNRYFNVLDRTAAVGIDELVRDEYVYGKDLPWGEDSFLGLGSGKEYRPTLPFYVSPTIVIAEQTTLYLDSVPVTLIPTLPDTAGLSVWLPNQRVLISTDLFGRFLPNIAPLNEPDIPLEDVIATLQLYKDLNPILFLPMHTLYISGEQAIAAALTVQQDALNSIHDQTLTYINEHHHIDDGDDDSSSTNPGYAADNDGDGVPDDHRTALDYSVDDIVNLVQLPADLVSSPYTQELAGTVASIVRALYYEHVGWFGGETHELASTLTPAAKAAALADALGGADNLIAAARTAELNARDLAGAEKALYLAEAAYEAAPDNFTAKEVYAQALRKNAFLQKSAQVRNYYLMVALRLGTAQSVIDFVKSGEENTVLGFSAGEFVGHFFGISGASLETVKIVTLPANGVLALAGASVTEGQEIPLADLGGLTFTPTGYWNGQTSFTWNGASGGTYAAQDATVTITIAAVNDAPVVSSPLADVTFDEDALSVTIDVSAVFTDPDGDPLSYSAESSNPALVSAALEGAILTLDFQSEQNGTATITVYAADPAGAQATDDLLVTVNPVNDAPWAKDQTELVTAGLARTFTLDYGDVETAGANLALTVSSPSHGTLDTSALPNVTYLAPAAYKGPDSFTYTITDRGDPDGCTDAPCAGALQTQATVSLDVAENAIRGRVYNDANANGSLDQGETGVAGVTVRLTPLDGSPAVEQVTAADGTYAFGSLLPGGYQVRQVLLPGYVQTTPDPADIDLDMGEAVGGVDFGVVYSADVSVTMTADVNDRTIIYTFVVTNNGPAAALEAQLFNVRPHGVSYTTIITTRGTCQGGNTVLCEFGTLAKGESVTVTIQANRTDTKNPIANTATVTASTFDISLSNNSATATVQ